MESNGFKAGQTAAKVESLECNVEELWKRLNEISSGVNRIELTLATQKGFMMAASAIISGVVSLVVAWLGLRK